ncbi:MAG: DNA translocase FtsK 4TM domain-containing protein [bacterium]|nr:DNA translocase FtsK 4TM domain-containing protein [bacterium]
MEIQEPGNLLSGERPDRFHPELIKIVLGLLILLTLVSQGPWDPDPINLLWPSAGLENWFGLPGALFAGFWWRFFGGSSLMLVLFLLFSQSTRARFSAAFFAALVHFLSFSLLVGLVFPPGHPFLERAAGLYGLIGNQAFSQMGFRFMAVLLLTAFLIKASLGYRLKGHFLIFLAQGVMGVVALLLLARETFQGLRLLSPKQLGEALMAEEEHAFGRKATAFEPAAPPEGQALMRRAKEAARRNEAQSALIDEDEEI